MSYSPGRAEEADGRGRCGGRTDEPTEREAFARSLALAERTKKMRIVVGRPTIRVRPPSALSIRAVDLEGGGREGGEGQEGREGGGKAGYLTD